MSDARKTFTVLVVDDCATTTAVIVNTLGSAGYSVLSARNGDDGFRLATERLPDLILLDIMMPGEDGFDTLRRLRDCPATVTTPVIFLTGMADIETKIQAFRLGAVDFIVKPFHPEEVKIRTSLHIRLNMANWDMIQQQREAFKLREQQDSKLAMIRQAQEAILVQPDALPDARFQILYKSLQEAGGDFYDVLPVGENTYGYFVADVSGHDIGTSFLTASVKALLRQNCSAVYSPAESMGMINRVLTDVLPCGKYMTACYVALNRKNMAATIVGMAHPPLIRLTREGRAELHESAGDVLGMFPNPSYVETRVKVRPGDRLFIFSDGLLEAEGEVWTARTDWMARRLEERRGMPLDELVASFDPGQPGGEPSDDDVLLMGIEV